jgi:NitT/TauT family transport system ATP-binding protein
MQQRVGIARALSKKPEILLMDEPFGAVDAQTREQLQEELLKIWAQTENTVVFVTHSIDEAIYLSDRVVVMQARPGRVKEEVIIDLPRPRWEGDIKADPRLWGVNGDITEASYDFTVAFLKKVGYLETPVPYKQFFDRRFVDRAVKELGGRK